MYLLILMIVALCVVIFLLLGKIYFLHKSALEIGEALEDRLASDTNTLIDVSSRDPYLRQLAADLNVQLRILRGQRHRYQLGDRELKEAVTGISHDLRTPLTAIRGYLDLLEQEDLDSKAQRYLSAIENRVGAMTELTEELFRYSLALSQEALLLEPVCLNAALEESIAAYYAALTSRGIASQIHLSGKRLEARLNQEALSRVFSNLLSNALKYSDGKLDITLSDQGEITFSNPAPGLTPVQVGRLFDRFFTVEAARSAGGLGLSIAKSLTERMGGTIRAELDGQVLTISLRFPLNS